MPSKSRRFASRFLSSDDLVADRGQQEKVEGPPGDERTLAVERIPAKYNLKTTLKLEVPKGRGRHEANFELQ